MKVRSRLRAALATAITSAVLLTAVPFTSAQAAPAGDTVADTYYEVLLNHTRWAEQQWDATGGYYRFADFRFAVVLGNAVLITRSDNYDAATTGVDLATLTDHTIDTIKHYAASNRLAGGTQWGQKLFWDSTYESYLVLAAHLMWDDLDQDTRDDIDLISEGQAAYAVSLGTGDDPLSGSWTPNGATGGFRGDTKLEEMGVYAQAIAPGIAWSDDHADLDQWSEALSFWMRNETGIRSADEANPALIDGVAVSDNTAQNVYDTFIGENHGSFGPHYQSEIWRTAGRNSIHFLMAGKELPEVLLEQPNHEQLLATIMQTMSDSGEPLMPMVDDREFLYGRDVIPLAYLAQVQGNEYAARAEQNLADRLLAYQAYGEAPRIAKFSGEAKYEPEARAEVAISYLLHEWRATSGLGVVTPVSNDQLFEFASGTTDYGATAPGLLAQQSPHAWAATIDRAGFTKFPWQPEHDDWLMDISGTTPYLLPSTSSGVNTRYGYAYSANRDGFEGTASLLALDEGYAGMTTLPTGSIVYATSGTGGSEGSMTVRNFAMPGIPGLDGSRTYTTVDGTTEYTAAPEVAQTTAPSKPSNVTRLDNVTFTPVSARYVKIQGVQNASNGFGYSLFETEIRAGGDTPNLAAGAAVTASSEDAGNARQATKTVDGSYTSRWSVSTADRPRNDTWIEYDLGSAQTVSNVRLYWEVAAARAYTVLVSVDGTTWTEASFQAPGASRVDEVGFASTSARYVRMQGVDPASTGFGYSVFEFEARNGALGTNLALGKTATASSAAMPASAAVDGSWSSRWAVSTADRPRTDSWLQVDLGSAMTIDRVRLGWEAASAQAYEVQVSLDGTTWTTVSFQAPAVFRADSLSFADTTARYVRMQGMLGNAGYGYSIHEFEVRDSTTGANLARAATATASSEDAGSSRQATKANDGSYGSRWAVATSERQRGDSWLQLDLGAAQSFNRVNINWESAAGAIYRVQVSNDGTTWTDVADYGLDTDLVYSEGDWLSIEDRVGLVVRNSTNPITVLPGAKIDKVVLSFGDAQGAAGMVVEGYAKTGAAATEALAARPAVATSDDALRASDADGYLSLFNLSGAPVEATATVPRTGHTVSLYQGTQQLTDTATIVDVALGAASSALLPPRFSLDADADGVVATVVDATTVLLAAPAGSAVDVELEQLSTGEAMSISLEAGESTSVVFDSGRPFPVLDKAVDRTTYPTSPLPAGMTDPDNATDDDACTVWTPGSANGRMVVDLGAETRVETVGLLWADGAVPAARLATSSDGLTYTDHGAATDGRLATTEVSVTARFVAVEVDGWNAVSSASLATLAIFDADATAEAIAAQLRPCGDPDATVALSASVWDDAASAWVAVDETMTLSVPAESELLVQLTADNVGDVDLTAVEFLADGEPLSACVPADLAVGDTLECEASLAVAAGRSLLEFVAAGSDPWARPTDGAAAIDVFGWKNEVELSLSVRNPVSGLWVAPTTAPGLGIPHDYAGALQYRYTVFNNGNQDLSDVEVTDAELGVATCAVTDIAAGDTATCEAAAPLTVLSYSSSATATALDPEGVDVTATSAAIHVYRLTKPVAPAPPVTRPGSITPGTPAVNTLPDDGGDTGEEAEPDDGGVTSPDVPASPDTGSGDGDGDGTSGGGSPTPGDNDSPVLPWLIGAIIVLLAFGTFAFIIWRRRLVV